jgi:hypothetical protein
MRKKQPSPTATPLPPSIESEQQVTIRSIITMTNILRQCLDPEFGVTPGQLCDLSEMYLAVMHMKKVTDRYFTENLQRATNMMQLAKQIEAEAHLRKVEGLTEIAAKTLDSSIELSMKEINALRAKMLEGVELMNKIPLPGTTIH